MVSLGTSPRSARATSSACSFVLKKIFISLEKLFKQSYNLSIHDINDDFNYNNFDDNDFSDFDDKEMNYDYENE